MTTGLVSGIKGGYGQVIGVNGRLVDSLTLARSGELSQSNSIVAIAYNLVSDLGMGHSSSSFQSISFTAAIPALLNHWRAKELVLYSIYFVVAHAHSPHALHATDLSVWLYCG